MSQYQNADDICKYLSKNYELVEDVKKAIRDDLESKIYDFDFDIEAESPSFQYEEEITEIKVNGFEFQSFGGYDIIFRPVNLYDDNSLTAESRLSVDVNVECSFSFFVYDSIDKDDVGMGGNTVNTQANLEVEVLITFLGDLDKVGAEVKVGGVKIEIKTPVRIDFGHIEPDWGDED